MAAFPLCYKTVYKDQNLPIQSIIRQNDKRSIYDSVHTRRSFPSILGHICRRSHLSYAFGDLFIISNMQNEIAPRCLGHAREGSLHYAMTQVIYPHKFCSSASHLRFIQGCYSKRDKFFPVWYSAESGNNEKQLRSLDSYFGKLQDNANVLSPLDSSDQVMQVSNERGQSISKHGLESLNAYLGKLKNGANQESPVPSTYIEHYNEEIIHKETDRGYYGRQNSYVNIRRTKGQRGPKSFSDTRQQDDASSLYLIGILASINIAVYLFEIASPIKNSDMELFSLPLLYGAKINHLIVVGEWWRLVTPMFLVQD